jgi:formylglycine-generating enzyme required for sulfatase activity
VNDFSEGASPYGVLNMAGNVWEWVADFYNSAYYSNSRSSNPTGPLTGENRVMRGGSYTDFVSTIRTIHRYGNYPLDTTSFIGFRCAMDAE